MDADSNRAGRGNRLMTPEQIHDLWARATKELQDNGIKNSTVNQTISKMKRIEARSAQSFEALFGKLKP